MAVFTLGLAKTPVMTTLSALYGRLGTEPIPGLLERQFLTVMRLGASIVSPSRMQLHTLTMFAKWESEEAIDHFLARSPLGERFAQGWHLRMEFVRRWGSVRPFADLPETVGESDPEEVVAVFTLARMKLLEVPRFIRWGRPVESLVRDSPESTFSMAAIRYPGTVATFSIWKSQSAMRDMVRGRQSLPDPTRHLDAMKERERRDFHYEFTTLRFRPLAEYGTWEGRTELLPNRFRA